MKVAVIIPTMEKTKDYLKVCVKSLRKTVNWDIIVVSNGGDNYPIDDIQGITIRLHNKNQGQCQAVNLGAQVVNKATDYLFIVNDDMYFAPGWNKNLNFDNLCFSPNLVEPNNNNGSAPPFLKCDGGFTIDEFNQQLVDTFVDTHEHENNTTGFNFPVFIRKDVWDTIGGYDTAYDPWGSNSDTDLQTKIELAGIQPMRCRDVLVYHFSNKSGTFDGTHQTEWQLNFDYYGKKWGFTRDDEPKPDTWMALNLVNKDRNIYHPVWEDKYEDTRTGHRGFVGKHLSELLIGQGHQVFGFDLQDRLDLRDFEQIRNVLDSVRPDKIFHLAGVAYIPESTANPIRTMEVNVIGFINLMEAIRQLGLKTKVQVCGTSEEYGDNKNGEDDTLNPLSPYAVSKIAIDYLARYYNKAYGIHAVVTRAFNHTGPGRGEMYAESSFAKQIAEIEAGKREYLEHGNLDAIRNYTDVRDMVNAYTLAIDLEPGVYNICSKQNVTIREVLDLLIKNASIPIETRQKDSLLRKTDFSFRKPSAKKFQNATGWSTKVSLERTMVDLLDYWRDQLCES